ncbi:hypothetical protein AX774_g2781 [Zancudomyces culisetae]|uniref:Uncharacterized protein n=1 Tax=Zancudomyces culisetae TaxID=1213189 RepID=A0A1R1PRU8_ZANCU|nr:hypothetical protein AX774_g2781 [Zancudomyces culisetae]|eukprot:OMH83705.1 hypothetical protein AX774_g2781 [Zancudomyces culisetae]
MMLIQIPLGYVIVYDIASKRGSSPSSWMSIFLSTTFQVVLLSLCMCYSFLESRRKKVLKRQPRKTDTSPLLR